MFVSQIGFDDVFAVLVTSGWFGKHRRSLRSPQTGKVRTNCAFVAAAPMSAFEIVQQPVQLGMPKRLIQICCMIAVFLVAELST